MLLSLYPRERSAGTQCIGGSLDPRAKVKLHIFSSLALGGRELSASWPGRFTPREGVPGTELIGGSLDSRAGLGVVLKRKIPSPCRASNPRAEIKLQIFVKLLLDGGEWSASFRGLFTSRERAPVTQWIGGLLESRACLALIMKRNIPNPCRDWNPRAKIKLYIFSSLALDGGEWSATCPSLFNPRGRTPGTPWIGGWLDPGAGLDVVLKGKIPSPCRDSNPRSKIKLH
jgi:hypothetical protein